MKLHSINVADILIPDNRQRRSLAPEGLIELAGSITKTGLIHPVVVRQGEDGYTLVAGERRIRAMQYIWEFFGNSVKCGEYIFPENIVPCIYMGDMDPLDAFEMELEENIRRVDLPWQERAQATTKLMELRTEQAKRAGDEPPTVAMIAEEVRGTSNDSGATRQEILVTPHLSDPDVAKSRTLGDAFKVLKRKEELQRSAELAATIGLTFSSAVHQLRHGDCFEIMSDMEKEQFDVILTDPPFGIEADKFGDSGGIAAGSHFYDDSWTNWNNIAKGLAKESFRLAKPQAHIYIFCDIDNFVLFKSFMIEAGWNVFRTPIIWINPSSARAPWPQHGPQRKYQIILFAVKGDKPVTRIYPDVITAPSDENLNHQAQKPVAVYMDLLTRSVRAGDSVLDPFAGTGTIIPAAHLLKCRATAIEIDASAYGIAITRLKELE